MPPENGAGVPGFRKFLKAIEDSEHEEHGSQLTRCGGSFNLEKLDISDINVALKQHKINTQLVKAKRTKLGPL